MMGLDLKAWLIIALGAVAALGGSYAYGRWDGSSACDNRHEKAALDDYKKRMEDAEAKSRKLEGELTQSRAYAQKMERLVTYEISKNSIYSTCVMPPDGVQLLNEAIARDTAR